jgi:cytochrome d ubiquinol oxidase subunit II
MISYDTFLGVDYPTLWYLVVGGLFSGYAILDGFDFGSGAWHLFFKKEENRRIALNAIGPVWDGNEVWLVIGGGALFAGFPVMYASLFSSMYVPFMLFLVFIIFRAVSIEFRSKEPMKWWRKSWDIAYSISSIMLAFLLGVVLGNVLQGIAIDENFNYHGDGFFDFLGIYPILVGLTTLSLFTMHGGIFLLFKTEGRLYQKIRMYLSKSIAFFILTFATTSFYTILFLDHLTNRFKESPVLFVFPLVTMLCIANIPRLVKKKKFHFAFVFSALSIAFMLGLVALELYPTLLISTLDSANHITIYNSASSSDSLGIMLLIAAIGTPLVLGYTIFVYTTFKGKVIIDENSY